MASATAFDDSVTFLYKHPWATTEADNAVELLRELTAEHEALQSNYEETERLFQIAKFNEADGVDVLTFRARLASLLEFVRGLHDTQKIGDLEFEHAKRLAGK